MIMELRAFFFIVNHYTYILKKKHIYKAKAEYITVYYFKQYHLIAIWKTILNQKQYTIVEFHLSPCVSNQVTTIRTSLKALINSSAVEVLHNMETIKCDFN
jgi:hypothetical protein